MSWEIVQQPTGLFAKFDRETEEFAGTHMAAGEVVDLLCRHGTEIDRALETVASRGRDRRQERYYRCLLHVRAKHGLEIAKLVDKQLGFGQAFDAAGQQWRDEQPIACGRVANVRAEQSKSGEWTIWVTADYDRVFCFQYDEPSAQIHIRSFPPEESGQKDRES